MNCYCGSIFVPCLHYACFPKTVRLLASFWELTIQFTNMMKTISHRGKSCTMSSKQTYICLTHSVYTKGVFAKTKLQLIIITTALH